MRPRLLLRIAAFATACLVAACGGSAGPSPASGAASGPSGIAVTRIDAGDADDAGAVGAALREHASAAIRRCDALGPGRTSGHMDLSIEIDAGGATVAGILHTTFGSDEVSECLARGLTGLTLPARGTPHRARVRFEGG